MIARIWEGKTTLEHGDVYRKLIEQRDIPGYQMTEGFVKHTFLLRSDESHTYFKLLTFWIDFDAITNFTGPHFEVAVAFEEDRQYLVDWPGVVCHFEVFATSDGV